MRRPEAARTDPGRLGQANHGQPTNEGETVAFTRNVQIVNNTGADIRKWFPVILDAIKAGELPEELADVFSLRVLRGVNPDGSDRGVVDWA